MTESNPLSNENAESIRPPYPPVITAQDLIPTDVSNKVESVRIPNAFIAYRMALVRELKSQKVACHRSNVSSLASRLWSEECEDVKNCYRKMATDAQLLHNQSRGLTFLSYESTSTDNVIMQDENNPEIANNNNNPSAQDIEAELLALFNLQHQPSLPQGNQILTSTGNLDSPLMYIDGNHISTTSPAFPIVTTSGSNVPSFDQFNNLNNLGNPYPFGGNLVGNMSGKGVYDTGRSLEQRIQILEQQMALFYQLLFGVTNYPTI